MSAGQNISAGSQAPPPVPDVLRQMLAHITGSDEMLAIPADTPLLATGAGLDSLRATLLLRQVQRVFGVDVAAEDLNLSALATLDALADFIGERTAGRGSAPAL
jgi:acyl carrier protein